MKLQNKFAYVVISILPMISIFLTGRLYPMKEDTYQSKFEPPSWVFGVVWTYLTLSFGYVSARVIFNSKGWERKSVIWFYVSILVGLVLWLPLFYYKRYANSFWLLIMITYMSIGYVMLLSYMKRKEVVALVPLCMWVALASCLNGVIYDRN